MEEKGLSRVGRKMAMQVARERAVGLMHELNSSGLSNVEISRQTGYSLSTVEKTLVGKKGHIWKARTLPPVTKLWRGGSEAASSELKKLKAAIGQTLWALWDTKTAPVPRRGPGRPAAVRPHQAIVSRAVRDLAVASAVSERSVWRWVFPSRVAELYRSHARPRKQGKEG